MRLRAVARHGTHEYRQRICDAMMSGEMLKPGKGCKVMVTLLYSRRVSWIRTQAGNPPKVTFSIE